MKKPFRQYHLVPNDKLFEKVLRNLSIKAFRALVNSGVRDINAFLKLDPARLVGIPSNIVAELLAAQQQMRKDIYGCYVECDTDDVFQSVSIASDTEPTLANDKHLFLKILDYFGTRARHALAYAHINYLRQFMCLKPDEMTNLPNTGAKTIAEIVDIQRRVREWIASADTLDANSLCAYLEKTHSIASRYAVLRPVRNLKTPWGSSKQSLGTIVQHSADDPAEWSVLKKTVPNIFLLDDQELEALWASAENQLVGDAIDFSEADWKKLAAAAIYKDDGFDILLATTLGRLLELQISSEAFDKIVNSVVSLINADKHLGRELSRFQVSDESIVTCADISDIEGFRIDSFDLPEDCIKDLDVQGLHSWKDLVNLTEKTILESYGLCLEALLRIRNAWKMKLHAKMAKQELSGLPTESYSSFRSMVECFVELVTKNNRHKTIVFGRLGLLNGGRFTYEELGKSLGLTRERVRQIWLKMTNKLKSPAILKNLNRFWFAALEYLKMSGGACLLIELAEHIRQRLGWHQIPEQAPLESLLLLRDDIKVDSRRALVYTHSSKCISCEVAVSAISQVFETNRNEKTVAKVAECLLSICRQQTECSDRCRYLEFSEGFLRMVADKTQDVMVEEGVVYHRETWGARRGSSVQIVENILKSAGRPMHFSEVCKEVKQLRPDDQRITEHNVHSWLGRSPRLIRWDRGTFIHRDFVVIPEALLTEIGGWLEKKLEMGIPFFSIAGAWAVFEDRLRAEGIPSETALYFCLRELSYPGLAFPRYPYVIIDSQDVERLPVSIVLEQFILESGSLVSFKDIRAYAVNKLGISKQMLPLHLSNAPNVVRGGKGTYVHVENLKMDCSKLKPILDHARVLVETEGHVSVEKVFGDKQVSCLNMGIDSPEMLYAVLQYHTDYSIELPDYPQILAVGCQGSNGGSRRIINQVADYIATKKSPCSFDELKQHFVDKLGYSEKTVYNVLIRDNVVRYSRGSIIHLDTLEWTNEKQHALEAEAQEIISQARKAGRCYALLNNLLEYRQLPDLANCVVWTKTLLAELLTRGGRFRVIGSARNAFVCIPNEEGIESFEDLAYEILLKDYNGACQLEQFECDLRESGIIQKQVTSEMLGDQRKVCISGYIIMLRELSDRA